MQHRSVYLESLKGLSPTQIPPELEEVWRPWGLSLKAIDFSKDRSEPIRRNSKSRRTTLSPVFLNRESNKPETRLSYCIWPGSTWYVCGCQKWVSQRTQSAFGWRGRDKSNSSNQVRCLSSASFSHGTTAAKLDFCQQSSGRWLSLEFERRATFKVGR